ncbi:MAG TPA: DUF6084 family protein [Ktedonobacteraceae bacterium]
MPDLNFEVVGVEAPAHVAAPTLVFKMRIVNMPSATPTAVLHHTIHNVILHCQLQIAATRRRYSASSQAKLLEVFGEPPRWQKTMHSLLWTHINVTVPCFTESVIVDVPVPCTYDFEVASTKYFAALDEGIIPLNFLFSGTTFYDDEHNNLCIEQIPWSKEATYQLPVAVWKEMMERFYPNSAWIRMDKDTFDQLYHYKTTYGFPTWETAFAQLLRRTQNEEVHS